MRERRRRGTAGTRAHVAVSATLATVLGLVACGDSSSTGPEGAGNVSLAFRAADGSSASAAATAARTPRLSIAARGGNGTLTIDRAHLVLDEFELERREGACGNAEAEEDDECEEFEAGPRFVELPLEEGTNVVVTQEVSAGSYVGLEFEVDDVEAGDDGDDGEALQSFLQQIRGDFPGWPEKASLRVEGDFTPTVGEARPFVAFFEAEIEIEKRFDSPLTVEEAASRTVSLVVAPDLWFTRPDGTVVDLSRFDHAETGRVAELEIEMEDGFTETEFDD